MIDATATPSTTSAETASPSSPDSKQIYSGIIGLGQSLGAGYEAPLAHPTPPLPYAYKLHDTTHTYDLARPSARSLSLAPLTEPFRPLDPTSAAYPHNIDGLTPHSSLAQTLRHLRKTSAPTVHTCVAHGGALLTAIARAGTENAYAASLFEAAALARLVREQGGVLRYDALVLTHGEADALIAVAGYADGVRRLARDYTADLREVTGQVRAPVLLLTQQHTCPLGVDVSQVVQDQWYVQVLARGGIVCAGPKYAPPVESLPRTSSPLSLPRLRLLPHRARRRALIRAIR